MDFEENRPAQDVPLEENIEQTQDERTAQETQQNEAIYPPQEVIENSEQFIHLSEETNLLMDQLWTEVMAKGDPFVKWGLPPVLAIAAIVIGKEVYKARKKAAYKRMSEDE